MDRQYEWRDPEFGYRDDAVDRIEGRFIQGRCRGETRGHNHDRITIRHRPRRHFHDDDATGSAAIVHDELLAQRVRQLLRELTGGDVAAAAWRERHDHPDHL